MIYSGKSLDTLLAPLVLNSQPGALEALTSGFSKAYHKLALESEDQFLPTPITALPDGTEKGQFLTLDLGGTNLRVAIVELFGSSQPGLAKTPRSGFPNIDTGPHRSSRLQISPQATWQIPAHLKTSKADDLFDWVARHIVEILGMYLPTANPEIQDAIAEGGINLGVTFSFPMIQESHTSALIQPMGKGFKLDSNNNDLSILLSEAYDRLKKLQTDLPKLNVVAITNDSISTLLAGGYVHNGNSTVGIIAGTGTNATCLCPLEKLAGFKKPKTALATSTTRLPSTHVLLNTEWSINGTLPPLLKHITKWDKELDSANEKPGFQPLEEMMGGRYLGELVRLVSLDAFEGQKLPSKFYKPYAVETKICSRTEEIDSDEITTIISLLTEYFKEEDGALSSWVWDKVSALVFKRICATVSTRAAALVASATVGILDVNDDLGLNSALDRNHNSEVVDVRDGDSSEILPGLVTLPDIVISHTGTVLERYALFRERCQSFINTIVSNRYPLAKTEGQARKVVLVESFEGGVVGAAVLAAMVLAGKT
ncbi:hypothetical protein DFH27DRAFT_49840 [Peziza echinospora]|nr:hypothetical protein DFH27DRAFT_49840 [Peziza echinospora]